MIYIITGSSSGVGFELAKILSKQNLVIGLSRTLGKAAVLPENYFKWLRIDFADPIESVATRIENGLLPLLAGRSFKLVINSALFYSGDSRPGHQFDLEIMQVNYLVPKLIIERLLNLDLKRVLFINSISGLVGQRNQLEYSASKHALQGYSSSLAKSAQHMEFDVMNVNPGGINTELWKDNPHVDTSDFISPILLANLIATLLQFDQRVFIDKFVILPPSDIN